MHETDSTDDFFERGLRHSELISEINGVMANVLEAVGTHGSEELLNEIARKLDTDPTFQRPAYTEDLHELLGDMALGVRDAQRSTWLGRKFWLDLIANDASETSVDTSSE